MYVYISVYKSYYLLKYYEKLIKVNELSNFPCIKIQLFNLFIEKIDDV